MGACVWWVDGGYMCESVIGGWTGDTNVGACDWWVGGGTCVRALVGGRGWTGIHV